MSELKNNSNSSIVTQDEKDFTNAIDSGERDDDGTTDSVEPIDKIKELGLKVENHTTKLGNKERRVVDSKGREFPVRENRDISSIKILNEEVNDINSAFDCLLTEQEVATLLGKNYELLSNPKKKTTTGKTKEDLEAQEYLETKEAEEAREEEIKQAILDLSNTPTSKREGEVQVGICPVTAIRIYAPKEETIQWVNYNGNVEYYLKDDVEKVRVMGDEILQNKPYFCKFTYREDVVRYFIEQDLDGEFEEGGVEYGRWCYKNDIRPWRLEPEPRPLKELENSYLNDRFNTSCSATRQFQFLNPEPKKVYEEDWYKMGYGEKNSLTLVLMKGGNSLDNEEALERIKPIRQNMFTGNIEFYGKPMEVSIAEVEHFQNKFNVKNSEFKAVVTNEALKNRYNPVLEHFCNIYLGYLGEGRVSSLSELPRNTKVLKEAYDNAVTAFQHSYKKISSIKFHEIFPKVPRTLKSLEEYISTGFYLEDKWYIDAVKKSMISAVARTFEPGCKVDETLILKGEQGVRKSTATEIIGFRDLGFQTKKMDNEVKGKEAVMNFQGGFIHEIDEIDRITCTRLASETKSFFTSSVDTYVPKYANNSINVPRHWIVIGTTNEQDLFLDHENRRYNVVEITQEVDTDYLLEHREIAWALAIDAYFNGEQWWYDLDSEGARVRRERNRDYMYSDARTSDVLQGLEQFELVDANMVARVLEGFDALNTMIPKKQSINEARDILKKSGWLKTSGKKTMPYGSRSKAAYINPDYKTPEQRKQERLASY